MVPPDYHGMVGRAVTPAAAACVPDTTPRILRSVRVACESSGTGGRVRPCCIVAISVWERIRVQRLAVIFSGASTSVCLRSSRKANGCDLLGIALRAEPEGQER